MKLNTETREVTRSGAFQETGFRIAANAKAFDILSSKLYTDTRLAIVRELSTNAYDAQKDAGNVTRPFDVHLPNSMEQFFSIRDYGTGMSPETIQTVYTTYFESTRSSSNEFVGALGLGSKSPFSYTDQFTVTSFYNGIEYTYSAFKAESGEPSIALLSQKPTKEENGVQIRINVNYYVDGHNFTKAAKDVYQFFSPRPNITGVRIDFPEIKPIFQGDGYAMYNSNDIGLSSRVSVVMGNVRYGVPDDILTKVEYYGRLVIYAAIGECSIAASRESLHVDSQTRANLNKRIANIQSDILEKLRLSIETETCLMNKLITLNKYSNVFNHGTNILSSDSIRSTKDGVYSLRKAWTRNNKMTISDNRFASQLNFSEAPIFVHDDLIVDWKQSDKNRLRHYLIGNNIREAFIAKIEDLEEFKKIFGEPTVTLSKLPDAPKAARGPRAVSGANKLFVKALNSSYGWENVEKVETEKACVIARNGNKVTLNGKDYSVDDLHLSVIARNLGFERVYGIATARLAKINEDLDLPLFEEAAKEHIENYAKNLDKYDLCRMMHGVNSDLTPDNLRKMAPLSQCCADLLALSKAKEVGKYDKLLMTCFGIELPVAQNFLDKFKERYPLLANLNMYYAKINDVTEYIQLKENKNAN